MAQVITETRPGKGNGARMKPESKLRRGFTTIINVIDDEWKRTVDDNKLRLLSTNNDTEYEKRKALEELIIQAKSLLHHATEEFRRK